MSLKTTMLELLATPFIQRAFIAGILTGLSLSTMGVFVLLRRSAFFGDAVAHFSFAGIAIGFLLGFNPITTAIAVSVLLAFGIAYLYDRSPLQSLDTIIGIFFSAAAALGIFIIGLLKGYRADLFHFLFGDIVAVSLVDVITSAIVSVAVIVVVVLFGKHFFIMSFNREMAFVRGVRVRFMDYLFFVSLALVTAMSIKIVGIILVPALLVIPAATAKNVSRSFHAMLANSILIGVVSVLGGLIGSLLLNTAAGATIVLVSFFLFLLSLLLAENF